jgi:hypothetical protein
MGRGCNVSHHRNRCANVRVDRALLAFVAACHRNDVANLAKNAATWQLPSLRAPCPETS